jgi:hypothetical protein
MSRCTTFRADVPGVDPDEVYKSVKLANGYRSWTAPGRSVHQVGPASIVISGEQPDAMMHVTASTHDGVYDALCRLGYMSEDRTIHEVTDEHATSGSRA